MSSASTRDAAVQAIPMRAYNAKCRSLNLVNGASGQFIDACIAISDHARAVGNELTAESTVNRNPRHSFREDAGKRLHADYFPDDAVDRRAAASADFPPSRR